MPEVARQSQGYSSRRQGFYGESLVQAIAASAGLRVSKEELEPEGIDLQIIRVRNDGIPKRQRIEVQIKSRSDARLTNEHFQVTLKSKQYHELNGRLGIEFDVPRYLILVAVPDHFSKYHQCEADNMIRFYNCAYWADLMGSPELANDRHSTTVSVPRRNLLTPEALVTLVCGDREEATRWMSA